MKLWVRAPEYNSLDRQVCLVYFDNMTKTVTSSDSRTRILETAYRLFYEQGYHATGINQIIAEAGVAKASFYHHFPSKKDLCIAFLQKRHRDWFSWLKQEVDSHVEPRERILSLFAFLEQWLTTSKFRGCAFLNLTSEFPIPDSVIRRMIVVHKAELREYIKELVQSFVDKTASPQKVEVASLADTIYVLFEGSIITSQVYSSIWAIQSSREAVQRILT